MARIKTSKSETDLLQEDLEILNVAEPEIGTESRAVAILSSVKSSAQAAQNAAAQVGPAVGNGLRSAAYKGIYSVAYGFTFGILMAGKVIPVTFFVTNAIQDGNSAAKSAFDSREARLQERAEESSAALSA